MQITIKNCRPNLKSELETAVKKGISKAVEGDKSYKLKEYRVHGNLKKTEETAVFTVSHTEALAQEPAKAEA